jgi:hypothetical protein
MNSQAFLENLKRSGLIAEEQIAEVSGRFANNTFQLVVDDLVDVGFLTPFQIQQLHAGQFKGLGAAAAGFWILASLANSLSAADTQLIQRHPVMFFAIVVPLALIFVALIRAKLIVPLRR